MSSDEEEHDGESEDEEEQIITVACRPSRLAKIIGKLNAAQIGAVKRIGFGGLLELKFKNFPLAGVLEFIDAFNDGSYVFRASETKEFMLSKHDVHDCFLLPAGPNPLPLVPTGSQKGSKSPENKALKARWREAYNVKKASSSIPLGKVFAQLMAMTDADDNFCRLFVLFSMSSFLAPTSNNGIDLKLLRATEDVSAVQQYDWCSYVLQNMVKAGEDSKKERTKLIGCIPFLMITYFQRFDFRGEICKHDLPLIKHWDEKRILDRLSGELATGGLGRQTLSKVKYPRCLNVSIVAPQLQLGSTSYSSLEKNFIQIQVPPGVEDDQQLKVRAVDDIHEVYLKLQRNSMVFYSWFADAISTIKSATTEPIGPVPSNSTQEFFCGENIHLYIDEVQEIAQRLKKSVANAPVFHEHRSETQKKPVEFDVSTRQVSEVLRDLANEGGSGDVVVSADKDSAIENNETDVNVAGELMVGVVRDNTADEVEDSAGLDQSKPRSIDLEQSGTEFMAWTDRQLLEETQFTAAELDEAFRIADGAASRHAQDDQPPNLGPTPDDVLATESEVPGEAEDAAVKSSQFSLEEMEDALYSTAEIGHVLNGARAAELHEEPIPSDVHSGTATPHVVTDKELYGVTAENVDATVTVPEWSVSQIPMTFMSESQLNEALCGVNETGTVVVKKGVVVDNNDGIRGEHGDTSASKRIVDSDISTRTAKRHCTGQTSVNTPEIMVSVSQSPVIAGASSVVRSRSRGKGDGLGCSMWCGESEVTVVVVSKFLRANQALIKDLTELRKHVADYCFLDDYKLEHNEPLVCYTDLTQLNRADILSMLSETPMSDAVIECWAMLLNRLEAQDNEFQRMSFFGLRHMGIINEQLEACDSDTQINTVADRLYEVWDVFIQDCGNVFSFNANLLFLPLKVQGHFACVCINYKSETVDLLDHKFYPDWTKSDVCKACKLIAAHISDYMDSRGVARGIDIANFEYRQIKFAWQEKPINTTESGIFAMTYMLMYEGETFDHADLEKKINRRYLVIQFAASLILADINDLREGIITKVNAFIRDKEDIWNDLHLSRRIQKCLTRK